jgi:hypothetical protein
MEKKMIRLSIIHSDKEYLINASKSTEPGLTTNEPFVIIDKKTNQPSFTDIKLNLITVRIIENCPVYFNELMDSHKELSLALENGIMNDYHARNEH